MLFNSIGFFKIQPGFSSLHMKKIRFFSHRRLHDSINKLCSKYYSLKTTYKPFFKGLKKAVVDAFKCIAELRRRRNIRENWCHFSFFFFLSPFSQNSFQYQCSLPRKCFNGRQAFLQMLKPSSNLFCSISSARWTCRTTEDT